VDALVTTFPASYLWPGNNTKTHATTLSATVIINDYDGKVTLFDEPKVELKKASEKSYLGPQHLPRLYLGIVNSSVVKEVHQKYSGVFGGVSPDVYSSALLAWHVKKYAIIDYPLIVPGAAPKSTTALSANKKHVGRFSESAHLQAFPNLRWPADIPMLYSTQTVWAYSMQAALDKLGACININLVNLYRSFELSDFELLKVLFRCSLANTKRLDIAADCVIRAAGRAAVQFIKVGVSRVLISRRPPNAQVFKNITNSGMAKSLIERKELSSMTLNELRG
jgi:hypothetical protein